MPKLLRKFSSRRSPCTATGAWSHKRQGGIHDLLAAGMQPSEEVRQLHEALRCQPVLQRRQAGPKHAPEVGQVDRVRAEALHVVHGRGMDLGHRLRQCPPL